MKSVFTVCLECVWTIIIILINYINIIIIIMSLAWSLKLYIL